MHPRIPLHSQTNTLLALVVLIVAGMPLAACTSTKTGTVTQFGQSIPAGGGMVQSFIEVKLPDGNVVRAWLENDDKLWTEMHSAAESGRTKVEIRLEGKFWRYVRMVQ